MATLEERIVADLEALRQEDPGCERHMFVFPLGLMAMRQLAVDGSGVTVVRRHEVAMVCRPEAG